MHNFIRPKRPADVLFYDQSMNSYLPSRAWFANHEVSAVHILSTFVTAGLLSRQISGPAGNRAKSSGRPAGWNGEWLSTLKTALINAASHCFTFAFSAAVFSPASNYFANPEKELLSAIQADSFSAVAFSSFKSPSALPGATLRSRKVRRPNEHCFSADLTRLFHKSIALSSMIVIALPVLYNCSRNSNTAATITLDSATTPTSKTRAS